MLKYCTIKSQRSVRKLYENERLEVTLTMMIPIAADDVASKCAKVKKSFPVNSASP